MPSNNASASEPIRAQDIGQVVLMRPLSFAMAALVAVVCACSLGMYLSLGEYTRRAELSGVLATEDTLLSVNAPTAGAVSQVQVHPGQQVKAGDVLFVFASQASRSAEQTALAKQAELTERLAAHQAQSSTLNEQINKQRHKLSASRAEISRLKAAGGERALSDPALLQLLDKAIEHRAQLQALETKSKNLLRDTESVQTAMAQLAQTPATQTQRPTLITAPSDGRVVAVMAVPGSAVTTEPLLTLRPKSTKLEAQFYVAAATARLVRPGQKVQLRFAGWPQAAPASSEGIVLDVSPEGERQRIRVRLPSQAAMLHGSQKSLTAGLPVEAEIVQGTHRLLEWAFESRLGAKGRS